MKWLRERGFIVCRVEQILHMPTRPFPFKKDAFGFGDLLAAHPEHGIFLIQVTSTNNINARAEKISDDLKVAPLASQWIRSTGKIQVHGWARRGPRGKRKKWTITILEGFK